MTRCPLDHVLKIVTYYGFNTNTIMQITHHLPWWGFPPCVETQPIHFLVPLVGFQHSANHCTLSNGVVVTYLFRSHFLYSLHATIHMSVQVHLQVMLHHVVHMQQTDIQKEICYCVYPSHRALFVGFPLQVLDHKLIYLCILWAFGTTSSTMSYKMVSW